MEPNTSVTPGPRRVDIARAATVTHVPPEQRLIIDDLGDRDDGITQIRVLFGFQMCPTFPRPFAWPTPSALERSLGLTDVIHCLSRISMARTTEARRRGWRKRRSSRSRTTPQAGVGARRR